MGRLLFKTLRTHSASSHDLNVTPTNTKKASGGHLVLLLNPRLKLLSLHLPEWTLNCIGKLTREAINKCHGFDDVLSHWC